jgi:heat shock protein HslJ
MSRPALVIAATLVASSALALPLPLTETSWTLRSYTLDGRTFQPPTASSRPRLTFEVDGKGVRGFAGCNQFTGSFKVESNALTIVNVATTRRACRAVAMELEGRFVDLLTKAERYSANEQTLLISSGRGNALTFERSRLP